MRVAAGVLAVFLAAVGVAAFGAAAFFIATEGHGWPGFATSLVSLAASLFFSRYLVVRLECDDAGIHVVNLFSKYRLAWGEIEAISAAWAYWGIAIRSADGKVRFVHAVPQSNLPLLGLSSRANRVAEYLERVVAERNPRPVSHDDDPR